MCWCGLSAFQTLFPKHRTHLRGFPSRGFKSLNLIWKQKRARLEMCQEWALVFLKCHSEKHLLSQAVPARRISLFQLSTTAPSRQPISAAKIAQARQLGRPFPILVAAPYSLSVVRSTNQVYITVVSKCKSSLEWWVTLPTSAFGCQWQELTATNWTLSKRGGGNQAWWHIPSPFLKVK